MITGIFIRRLIAMAIDAVYFLPGMIFLSVFEHFKMSDLSLLGLVFIPLVFILRDVISNRSIGKCVMGLHIIDKTTYKNASVKQKLIRNLFFFVMTVDILVLFIKGESIGDMVSNTSIVKSEVIK